MSESKEQQPEPVFVQPKPYKVQLESGKVGLLDAFDSK